MAFVEENYNYPFVPPPTLTFLVSFCRRARFASGTRAYHDAILDHDRAVPQCGQLRGRAVQRERRRVDVADHGPLWRHQPVTDVKDGRRPRGRAVVAAADFDSARGDVDAPDGAGKDLICRLGLVVWD